MDGEMELEPCAINNVLLNCDPYLVWPGVMLECTVDLVNTKDANTQHCFAGFCKDHP